MRAEARAIERRGVDLIRLDIESANSINIGASFCQKESIKHKSQLEEFITVGNQ